MKRVQLSHGQFYTFTEWLKKNGRQLFEDGPKTYKEIALKAQEELHFAVSDSGVKSGLEVTGLLEAYHAAKGEPPQATAKAIRILAQQVISICTHLGLPTVPGLKELEK